MAARMSNRPGNREKINKIGEALNAVQQGCRIIGTSKHLVADLEELGIEDEQHYWDAIEVGLGEISAIGPVRCYAGKHPPEKSYDLRGAELWAYRWPSNHFGCEMVHQICDQQSVLHTRRLS